MLSKCMKWNVINNIRPLKAKSVGQVIANTFLITLFVIRLLDTTDMFGNCRVTLSVKTNTLSVL